MNTISDATYSYGVNGVLVDTHPGQHHQTLLLLLPRQVLADAEVDAHW